MKVLVVFGTRPEAVKCFPVVEALRQRQGIKVVVCVTAQHRRILDQVLDLVDLVPDYDLELMRAVPTLTDITCDVLQHLGAVLDAERPDLLLVQGDTTTAMAAALASFYRKIPIGHIEAGLRTGDMYSPWPEEANRRLVSVLGNIHFAPTPTARDNLLKEHVPASAIHVTGNTVIDALHGITLRLKTLPAFPQTEKILAKAHRENKRVVLITAHRRENWGDGLREICSIARRLASRGDVHVVYPVHPNPNVRKPVHEALFGHPDISLLEPLCYLAFVDLMSRCHLILTDSGGIQEEAPALGKPVLVLRDTTERPEGIASGSARLVGRDPDFVVAEAERLLDDEASYQLMSRAQHPYGDGHAASRIADLVAALAVSSLSHTDHVLGADVVMGG